MKSKSVFLPAAGWLGVLLLCLVGIWLGVGGALFYSWAALGADDPEASQRELWAWLLGLLATGGFAGTCLVIRKLWRLFRRR
jgi:hypothetical protein